MHELIDHRNEWLWNKLNNKFKISFKPSSAENYGVFSQNDDVVFYINTNNLCKDSFTHEMLHVYLRLKECFISSALTLQIYQSNILTKILSPQLIEHIGNSLDHIKILPIFLDMGFDRRKFIIDFETFKCKEEELRWIVKNYKNGNKLNYIGIDQYLGKLFAIFADPNNFFDYSKQLYQLEKVDPLLYKINFRMVEKWKIFDLDKEHYHPIITDYYQDLKKWINANSRRL